MIIYGTEENKKRSQPHTDEAKRKISESQKKRYDRLRQKAKLYDAILVHQQETDGQGLEERLTKIKGKADVNFEELKDALLDLSMLKQTIEGTEKKKNKIDNDEDNEEYQKTF